MPAPEPADRRAARAIVLDARDNVAVATVELAAGADVAVAGHAVTLCDPIPVGHKFALGPIAEGGRVLKYGEVIGTATAEIAAGGHVHVHNVVSARLPGAA
jgi:altronate dehydratase